MQEEIATEQRIISGAIHKLRIILLSVDGGIVVVAGAFGYYLAGRTLQPIQKSLERQKRFVSDAAHELRTPLAAIKTGIEITNSKGKTTLRECKNLLSELLEEVDYLINMTNDLLFLARTDEGIYNVTNMEERVNISSICSKQVLLLKSYADKKKIHIKEDIRDTYYIKGNEEELNRLVANLLRNAIDYNRPNGEVSLFLNHTSGTVILQIVDTGMGISSDDLKHIFERFYKADKSRSTLSSGAGLGLSIVKEIVDRHKASIKIQSELGKGTEIKVIFHLS